jgi:hypothetical protein
MSDLADSGPAAGGTILAVLSSLGYLVIWLAKWLRERERTKRMKSVPPSELAPPPPAVDRAVLARLDRAEQHDAIVGALLRTQGELVDEKRKNEVLRDANNRLSLEVYALKQDNERKDVQLRAERQSTRTLREQLAHVEAELAAKTSDCEVLAADLRRALLVREG